MTYLHIPPAPMVLADLVPRRALTDTALVVSGAALTALAAQVSFALPGTPVPVTAQTAVLLTAGALGARRGVLAQVLYLLVGIAGVPVFADGIGLRRCPRRHRRLPGRLPRRGLRRRCAGQSRAGPAVPHLRAPAGRWQPRLLRGGRPVAGPLRDVSLAKACAMGLWPFLLGDALKALVVAVGTPSAWRLASRYDRG